MISQPVVAGRAQGRRARVSVALAVLVRGVVRSPRRRRRDGDVRRGEAERAGACPRGQNRFCFRSIGKAFDRLVATRNRKCFFPICTVCVLVCVYQVGVASNLLGEHYYWRADACM